MAVKDALAEKTSRKNEAVKLTKNMSIADMIKAMEPEIKKALPQVITPERFTRMALSALNTTPKLAECSQMSFLGALMNAAQLGLEPNTPLGQAYLIPYRNKGKLECQFQMQRYFCCGTRVQTVSGTASGNIIIPAEQRGSRKQTVSMQTIWKAGWKKRKSRELSWIHLQHHSLQS